MTAEDSEENVCSNCASTQGDVQPDDFDIDLDLQFVEGAAIEIEEDCRHA